MDGLRLFLTFPFRWFIASQPSLFPWIPVCIALGVGFWFSLVTEPGQGSYAVAILATVVCLALRVLAGEHVHAISVALACVFLGFLAAGLRGHTVSAPILEFRYYGAVQGRIVSIDRSQSDQTRLTLDQVVLDRVASVKTPVRVRVSLHAEQDDLQAEPGMVILVTAHLSAPEGPVEPGGFDFQRMAFFDKLGAVGYSRTPALLLEPALPGAQRLNRLRADLRRNVETRIAGDPGAFSAALITGDRAGIGQETLEDLRKSNLAHLLAISGLHMGLLSAFVFALIRYGLALVPWLALRVPTKKVAAVVALLAGGFYLLLSGGNVATERAFIMVAVMLTAILLDRRALSLRSVSIAACILLLLQPETLLEPGFQMSFAATVALVAGFRALQEWAPPHRMKWWLRPVMTVMVSSLLAGFATAPIGAAHFNRLSSLGFFANLAAVPVMGTVVMPAGVIAGLLAPFGLEKPALWVMEQGTAWILAVAKLVANIPGTVSLVHSPEPWVLPVFALGGIWFVLSRGWARGAGAICLTLAMLLWGGSERPPMLVSAEGALVGVLTETGRALSAPKGAGFAARQWLENDGDQADQLVAAMRVGFHSESGIVWSNFHGWNIAQIKGKFAEKAFGQACQTADLVIAGTLDLKSVGIQKANISCKVIDKAYLLKSGPLAIWPTSEGNLRLRHSKSNSRIWNRNQPWRDQILSKPTKAESMAQQARQ